jgi:hypothetical protein
MTGSRSGGWILAGVIVLVGGSLRWAYHDLDYRYPDEAIASAVVGRMRQTGDWDTNWIKADVPSEMRENQYNFSSYHYAVFMAYRAAKLVPALEGWRSQHEGFVLYRFVSVACAIAGLIGIMALGGVAGGWLAALFSGLAALAAVLLVQDAHYVRPEAFMTLLMVAVLLLAWPSPQRSLPRLLIAGVLMGLLLACKVSLALVAWVPLVAAWCHGATVGQRIRLTAAAGAALAAGFALGAPGAVLQPDKFLHGVRYLTAQYARGHPPHGHISGAWVWDLELRYVWVTLGGAALGLAAVGAVSLWRRSQIEALALLALPPLILGGYFATQAVFFERNLSPVLPMVLVLAGIGGASVVKSLGPSWRWGAGCVCAALLLVEPLRVTWPLVVEELSVRGPQQRAALDDMMRARWPESRWMENAMVGAGVVTGLEEHFRMSGQPVLLRATDYHDEWSEQTRRQLAEKFNLERLEVRPSEFQRAPVCTLLTYHSARATYYRVTGLKLK